jgi:SET domain-containing protein
MFCRRILFAFALRNPSSTTATPRPLLTNTAPSNPPPSSRQQLTDEYEYIYTPSVVFTEGVPTERRPNHGKCGCTDNCAVDGSCINRACNVECDKNNCSTPCCSNRWSGRTLEDQLEVFDTVAIGRGLRTTKPIPTNTVVIEYCGEYISHKSYKARRDHSTTTYFMKCDETYGIDARFYGNTAPLLHTQPGTWKARRGAYYAGFLGQRS